MSESGRARRQCRSRRAAAAGQRGTLAAPLYDQLRTVARVTHLVPAHRSREGAEQRGEPPLEALVGGERHLRLQRREARLAVTADREAEQPLAAQRGERLGGAAAHALLAPQRAQELERLADPLGRA
eukprot:CAMPEP_0202790318 /NCGR_PEP_ID=MMETSP1388-20130828/79172_1 /ASSEMBLY_ACC=CAM_ASM_000864 /TAXON_ID=37098 /ORGANISM="Isochrysis sp, Strain CCMP1244" /LENGTH=126 /DNA_ID=CAMNT_0049460043 /DNA_START=157 /DNA_END=535 /DNA_ORIENTATION=-